MIQTDFLIDQIQRFSQRLAEIRRGARQGDQAQAAEDLGELRREVDDAVRQAGPDQREAMAPVKAQVHAELGLLLSGLGDVDEALGHLEVARQQIAPLVGKGEDEQRLVELYGTILLNAGATQAAARDFAGARKHLAAALDYLDGAAGRGVASATATSLRLAALQNRATIAQQEGDAETARADLERALALAEEAAGQDETFAGRAVDVGHRLTAHLFHGGHDAEALAQARANLARAEASVGDEWGPAAALFVHSKMILAELCFATGALAEGEDHLFETLDAVPDLIDPVLAGFEHYLGLWRRDDAALEAGGLPRDEVGDSLAELLAKLDARCLDGDIRATVRARYDLVVNGLRGGAEGILASALPEDAPPRLSELRERLRQDLEGSSS